jgi:hypothetical protein
MRHPLDSKGERKGNIELHISTLCYLGLDWVLDFFIYFLFFVLFLTILYYIQNYEYRKILFFEIIFGWFREPEIKLERN